MKANVKLYNNNIPLNVYDVIHNNSEIVHKKLFDEAINKYCSENDKDKSTLKIIDQPNKNDNLKPSVAIIIENGKINYVDLTEYWNKNYIENYNQYENNKIFNDLLINEDNKKHINIEYIDYVNGKVQFRNKFTNKTFFINFDKLDKNKNYYQRLKNTFTSLYYD